jgi:small subunit ribosomal protein S17
MEFVVEDKKIIKTFQGQVVSDKMDKTVVVLVEYRIMHPLYKKYVKRYEKFKAHDSENSCKMGDVVKIESCKPISKEKKWKVVEILSHAK